MSFTIVPLLFLDYYKSLSQPPRLPPSPTPLDHVRYCLHKSYYQYIVTFSGYMLDPVERFLFDLLLGVLFGATVWCSTLITPPLGRLVLHSVSGGAFNGKEMKSLGEVVVEGMSGNMTMRVTTVLGTVETAGNCTANWL